MTRPNTNLKKPEKQAQKIYFIFFILKNSKFNGIIIRIHAYIYICDFTKYLGQASRAKTRLLSIKQLYRILSLASALSPAIYVRLWLTKKKKTQTIKIAKQGRKHEEPGLIVYIYM